MDQNSFWEANLRSTDHEFPRLYIHIDIYIMAYITQLSVAQTIWRRTLQRLMDSELERKKGSVCGRI